MGWWDYSGGEMTNWGAHGLDMIQCALGMDGTGPVEWWPLEDGPKDSIGFRYGNGVSVRLELPPGPLMGGAVFIGEKGRIEIIRDRLPDRAARDDQGPAEPGEVQLARPSGVVAGALPHGELAGLHTHARHAGLRTSRSATAR